MQIKRILIICCVSTQNIMQIKKPPRRVALRCYATSLGQNHTSSMIYDRFAILLYHNSKPSIAGNEGKKLQYWVSEIPQHIAEPLLLYHVFRFHNGHTMSIFKAVINCQHTKIIKAVHFVRTRKSYF